MKLSIREISVIGLFTAVIAVVSQLSIPMPYGVPMTMQTFIIPFAGIVLGAKKGTLAATIYVLLGAVGIPVFAGFSGGMGHVLGMTGGFILSFPVMAFAAGVGADKNNVAWLTAGLVAGAIINYVCGMLWFGFVTSCGIKAAFTACVLPFIPTALFKIVLVALIGRKIRGMLKKEALA